MYHLTAIRERECLAVESCEERSTGMYFWNKILIPLHLTTFGGLIH